MQFADPASEYLPVRQPPCVTTPGTQRRHEEAGISEMKLCVTHSTPDDAPNVARLLTCLAPRAIRRPGLRRVFACQTATMRYHTWHAASSWGCRYQRDGTCAHAAFQQHAQHHNEARISSTHYSCCSGLRAHLPRTAHRLRPPPPPSICLSSRCKSSIPFWLHVF